MAFYLAYKEVLRNRGRFVLFSLVIALITVLVLFIAALAQGLAYANKEYISKLDAELLVFQKNVDLSLNTSRIGRSKLNDIQRVEGVAEIGSIGFSAATLVVPKMMPQKLAISLIGIESGKPGTPPIIEGRNLGSADGNEAILDGKIASKIQARIGDEITIKTIQGTKEKLYTLRVIGITDGQQYLFQPSVFVPYRTWDRIRPQANQQSSLVELTSNVVAIKLSNPSDSQIVAERILNQVPDVEVSDKETAIKSIPGYAAQQSTLNTQQFFTLLIGILVIGGFFQIQILQKIPLIGVLKAIGTSNKSVALSVVLQIVLVTTFGVLLGGIVTLLLSIGLPASIPINFNGSTVAIAILSLLLIGPLGGLVSVRLAVTVEPLKALGLSS
jgi:putative ABC transport system permease protein